MMEFLTKRYVFTGSLISYALLMIAGAVIPNGSVHILSDNSEYFHFFGFVLFSFLILAVMRLYDINHPYIWSISGMIIFILLTESLQLIAPGRDFSVQDMSIDATGSLLGSMLFLIVYKLR